MDTFATTQAVSFPRLVQVYKEHSQLVQQLRDLSRSLARTRRRLDRLASTPALSRACIDRGEAKRAAVLGRLRDLRPEARRLAAPADIHCVA
jgi:hypothetical protein